MDSLLIFYNSQFYKLLFFCFFHFVNTNNVFFILIVPILGSLADLNLSKTRQVEIFRLAHAAVSIVDEEDLPSVARTLLRVGRSEGNRTNVDNPSIQGIFKLRECCIGT